MRYVDRMSAADLHSLHPEIGETRAVEVDVIDDGETLARIESSSQDFVVANHFIEHCADPIRAFQTFFRVLKPNGVVFLAVPDKRFTFDVDRPCTTIEHIKRDYAEGPSWSKRQHFEEWSRLVNKRDSDGLVEQEVQHLLNIGYSIHYHVWRAEDFLEFLAALREYVSFELELFLRNGFENVVVLRKLPTSM